MADYRKDLKAFTDSIKANLDKVLKNEAQKIGIYAKDTIYKRVKSGGGVDDDTSDTAAKTQLKKLHPNYVNYRKKYPGKGDYFSPGRSNLTYTGQMLDAIDFKVSKGVVTLFIKNNKRDDGKHTNKEIAEFNRVAHPTRKGKPGSKPKKNKQLIVPARPFFTLTVPEQRVLFRDIEKNVRDFIRLAFKKG